MIWKKGEVNCLETSLKSLFTSASHPGHTNDLQHVLRPRAQPSVAGGGNSLPVGNSPKTPQIKTNKKKPSSGSNVVPTNPGENVGNNMCGNVRDRRGIHLSCPAPCISFLRVTPERMYRAPIRARNRRPYFRANHPQIFPL